MRTRTKGVQVAEDGSRDVDKQYKGRRIFARLGAVSQDEAEAWLRSRQAEIDVEFRKGDERNFGLAARKYLIDCEKRKVRTIDLISYHINLVLPYIGAKPLESVHSGSLEAFCDSRILEDKVTPSTVNRTLEVVRTILNKSARVWRGEDNKPWLGTSPLIEMLDEVGKRQPHPITWDEQKRLLEQLPLHLERMVLFAVNTGLRDENVCGLKWAWEQYIPELERSVFVVPASEYKGNRPHVAILNDVAMSVVESCRGLHADYVFTYLNEQKDLPRARVDTINNTSWQKARTRAGLGHVRVHDLRHTYAQRLRDAGVSNEDRSVLMGHATSNMSEHYATPTIAKLVEMANLVAGTRGTPTLLRIVNGSQKVTQKVTQRKRA